MAQDPVEVYDRALRNDTEPELDMPEETKEETSAKIIAEQKKADLLQDAIDYDIGKDNNPSTIVTGLHTDPALPTKVESMVESRIDNYLELKRNKLRADLNRLRLKYLTPIDENIQNLKEKQKEITSYDSLTLAGARSARSYLQGLKKRRRSKKAGRKAGEQSSAT